MSQRSAQWPPQRGSSGGHPSEPSSGGRNPSGPRVGPGGLPGWLRPPWEDPRQGADTVVWTVVGFIGVLVASVLAIVLAVLVIPRTPWWSLLLPGSLLPLTVAGVVTTRPLRVRAVAYGAMIGFAAQLAMLIVLFVVAAGIRAFLVDNASYS